MGVLSSIVQALAGAMPDMCHDLLSGCSIRPHFAGAGPLGLQGLLLQHADQKTHCDLAVSPGLHDLIESVAIRAEAPDIAPVGCLRGSRPATSGANFLPPRPTVW
jgi:hypothetical protein